ncbi:ATP-binding cassette domain-containing protein [Janibacter sp. G1551]|uniref:ATP-binding cassette domain-containing protein n=1 Tax=Janibacter sp. G1551 TaxID=3420440 RepID=UPI003CFF7FAE
MSQETHLAREIRTQPDNWLDVADRVAEFEAVLPARGQRVLAVGCGTSFYMAQSYARLRADAGYGTTHAAAASEVPPGAAADYDKLVVISRSGTTTEVIALLEELAGAIPTVAIVATQGTRIPELADDTIFLSEVDEQSVVQTRFATTALALLRSSVGGADAVRAAAKDAREVIETPVEELLGDLLDVEQITFLALYPHMTVAENIGFHLKIAGEDKAEITKRVAEAAQILDLTQYLDRKPAKLSGGQRQRVAMGRAIVRQPQVFLMDEPLSNLDAKLRVQTRTQIASLQRRLGVTTVYVTHDQVEAMTMGDRVAVLKDGVLQQVASPIELFRRPANIFVAGFIGSPGMNLIRAKVVDGAAILAGHAIPLTESQRETLGGDVVIGIRPEGLVVTDGPGDLRLTTEVVEELGSDRYLYCTAGDVQTIEAESGREGAHILTVRDQRPQDVERGEVVDVTIVAGAVHVFDPTTGLRVD